MAITKMMAIEYNTWLSLMAMLVSNLKSLTHEYSDSGIGTLSTIPVLPSYSRDLSTFHKPSIIVQKVNTDQSLLGFGGFIGQYKDTINNEMLDVYGVNHEITFQIDVNGDSNIQRSLISAILTDDILNPMKLDGNNFSIYNYAKDLKSPVLMGYGKFGTDLDVTDLSSNINNDYITAIRTDVTVNQVIVPDNQTLIDLTKWIKINQVIRR